MNLTLLSYYLSIQYLHSFQIHSIILAPTDIENASKIDPRSRWEIGSEFSAPYALLFGIFQKQNEGFWLQHNLLLVQN